MESDAKEKKWGQPNTLSANISTNIGSGTWQIPQGTDGFHASSDAGLFSSSLPVLPHEKLNLDGLDHCGRSINDGSVNINKDDTGTGEKDPMDNVELNALPGDEDELLAGIMDALDLSVLPNQVDDLEDYDLFGIVGGMELESEPRGNHTVVMSNLNISDGDFANGFGHHHFPNSVGTVSGEHPYGEHPSRTLFVRNINSNVEDSELRSLFEEYGDIRTLYTASKHRGFVMISYYDIRAARTAMRALQNKPLRRRKLDIHFSIPKDNPSEKDMNQGTLVIFNLDPSVSNDDVLQIFGAYGEVKEIRETPNKRHHKFIEYYDVRAAEAALKALNRIDIAGKRIKLEPSRPGGARRSLVQQITQELERDDAQVFLNQVGSPVASSPAGNWSHFGSLVDRGPLHAFSGSPGQGTLSPINANRPSGLASLLPHHLSSSPKIAPIGKDQTRISNTNPVITNSGSVHGSPYQQSYSLPEQNLSADSPSMSAYSESNPHASGIGTLSGPEFLWGSPKSPSHFPDHVSCSLSSSPIGHHPFSYATRRNSFLGSRQHHVGSAPSGIHLDRHLGYFPDSPRTSFMSSIGVGVRSLNRSKGGCMANVGPQAATSPGFGLPGNVAENVSPSFCMMSMPRPLFPVNGSYPGLGSTTIEGFLDHGDGRQFENAGNQINNKKQFQLDLDKIISGEDTRTTLMIKNIPNKYTSKMLLAVIDENHKGTYDFLYLPIDFKNKCNVGYAFINMVSPSQIISFYQSFNGKRWEKFNSEKVASLAYARIQGKAALVAHFQNSSLMNEDKRCRPILIQSEGQYMDDQEHLVSSNLNIFIRQPDGSYSTDSLESPEQNQQFFH